MFDRVIFWSLQQRFFVLCAAALLLVAGLWVARSAPLDVFPDLTAPTVTVLAEAPGLAAEEVERQVTLAVENVVNGADGVRRVRSQSVAGFSLVWVEFRWGTDIYRARQSVTERLSQLGSMPAGVERPQLGPITSIMGEIMYVGLRVSSPATLMQARESADWLLTPQLLAIPGVAQVTSLGGEVRQYQVLLDPERMRATGIGIQAVRHAVAAANHNASGGVIERAGQDIQLTFLGRIERLADLRDAVVGMRGTVPLRLRHIAEIRSGPALAVGDGGVNGEAGVVLAIAKQPAADTLALTGAVIATLEGLAGSLPAGVAIIDDLFRQADFISLAVRNVTAALRDGALLVAVVLFAFLLNARTTVISLLAIPLSLLMAVLVLGLFGASINTMTLGGMTIAIGALVDDAIIFIESIFRRLQQNQSAGEPRAAGSVIGEACAEVSQPVVYSTVIIMLVFLPLFFLGGIEGQLLRPLGVAYLVAIATSLLVALTLTPVLAQLWLAGSAAVRAPQEPAPVRKLRSWYRPLLHFSLAHARWMLGGSVALVVLTAVLMAQAGRSFLPQFNEGALTIEMLAPPGIALAESARLATEVERMLIARPEILSVARRTGRAELDEHTQPAHVSELDVRLAPLADQAAFLDDLRHELAGFGGLYFSIGQPISHRIDHMLSGVRANLAIKVFGPSLGELHRLGSEAAALLDEVPGLVDIRVEPLVEVPQLRWRADREAISRYGLTIGEVAEAIEVGWRGERVSEVFEADRRFDLVVRLANEQRGDVERLAGLPLHSPAVGLVALSELVDGRMESGAGTVLRENSQRRLVVSANVAGRDLHGTVNAARDALGTLRLPAGYRIEYGGQFEAEAAATRTLGQVTLFVLIAMLVVLFAALRSWALSLMVMINVPLALFGGICGVWLMGGVLTVPALVGLIALLGIAVRNGLLLISRYQVLDAQGIGLHEVIEQGSLERLAPILMTALTAAFALIPLAMGLGQPGTEIQAPMAVVILGGLLTSTLLNMLVVPAIYLLLRSHQIFASSRR
jgi:CzcA family heavy metal efflux pump